MDELKNKFTVRTRAIIIHEGRLLVVKNIENTFLSLPGGAVEPTENIKESLVREIIEELGVRPEIGRLLYVNRYTDLKKFPALDFFFEVTNPKDFIGCEQLNRTHAHEISQIVWLNPQNNEDLKPDQLNQDLKNGTILSGEVRFIN